MDPSKRFPTLIMAAGVVVLLVAILIGERTGDRVFVRAGEEDNGIGAMPIVTPIPSATTAPYGPDWKASQALAAAPDPGFPDPRVPPKPLPTAPPPPTPTPKPRWTPNPNLPIWDQTPPPSGKPATATPAPSAPGTPSPDTTAVEATPPPN